MSNCKNYDLCDKTPKVTPVSCIEPRAFKQGDTYTEFVTSRNPLVLEPLKVCNIVKKSNNNGLFNSSNLTYEQCNQMGTNVTYNLKKSKTNTMQTHEIKNPIKTDCGGVVEDYCKQSKLPCLAYPQELLTHDLHRNQVMNRHTNLMNKNNY